MGSFNPEPIGDGSSAGNDSTANHRVKNPEDTEHLRRVLQSYARYPRVTEDHYNRATSISASKIYAEITNGFLRD